MHEPQVRSLARVSRLQKIMKEDATDNLEERAEAMIRISNPPFEFRVNLQGLVNVDEEGKRLKKEIEKLDEDLNFLKNKLSKETFLAKAPPELVEKERRREKDLVEKRNQLNLALDRLKKFHPMKSQ
jgi:valyl-tRNA synthetase